MPEVKNAFIKSKMNKDLDARLLPSGEYRDAINVQVSKSEGADVGAVENIKGNGLIQSLNSAESVSGLNVIGYYADEATNCLYIFSTNQNVNLNQNLGVNAKCFIHKYDFNGQGTLIKLVEGSFLNFDKNSYITGAHLLEDLLFFTDNRNQPRVINVTKSLGYYINEDHISVAKFAPVKPISLLEEQSATVNGAITSQNTFIITGSITPIIGDYVISNELTIGKVQSYNAATSTVTLDRTATLSNGVEVLFKRTLMVNKTQEHLDDYNKFTGTIDNPNYDPTWEGDSDFLEDKFVRFSYRFKFDDNQYSILAPFTQPIFIPKQFGYFLGDDEEQTYKTSVVNFFQNFIQEAVLKIPLPSSDIISDFKIKEIDIIYKESDALSVKVMSSISAQSIINDQNSTDQGYFYNFNYTSKKPYKTLPEKEIVRVYDKVPVKSQSQEIISNRVVYGNYVDKNSPPAILPNYYITSGTKQPKDNSASEYPSHTLKQNRTYQVGIVLSDRYGRSTSVLLSSRDTDLGGQGSSIFHKFNSSLNVEEWDGDVMQFILDAPIEENENSSISYPGFYASSDNGNKSWDIDSATVTRVSSGIYSIDVNITSFVSVGDYFRGKDKDYVEVTNVDWNGNITTVECDGDFSDTYITPDGNPGVADKRFAYTINNLGWYSYKIVVKQTEQEYYNVYLPLVINGEFGVGAGNQNPDEDSIAQAVLINDNINKVPRDLSEVGPDQKQYGSSVRLFGRVTPERASASDNNEQWNPNISSDQVSKIATVQDSGYDTTNTILGIYKSDSNPLLATISSLAPSGSTDTFGRLPIASGNISQNLSIYETNPTISLLDIFWESSTAGLISDLNSEALNSYRGVVGIDNSSYSFNFEENDQASVGSPFDCTSDFRFINTNGPIPSSGPNNPVVTATLQSCVDDAQNTINVNSTDANREFQLVAGVSPNTFKIQATKNRVFLNNADIRNFNFTFNVTYEDSTTNGPLPTTVISRGELSNSTPTLTQTSISHTFTQSDTTLFNLSNYIDNGTVLTGSKDLELVYNVFDETNPTTNTDFLTVNPSTGVVSKPSSSVPSPITLIVNANDANNGVGTQVSPNQTHVIDFGPPPSNISGTLNVPNGGSQNRYMVGTIGSSSNPTASFPGSFPSTICGSTPNTSCYVNFPINSGGLTQGSFTMNAKVTREPYCSYNVQTVVGEVWVFYQTASGNSWIVPSPQIITPGYGLNGQLLMANSQNVFEQFSATFSTTGIYRVMARFIAGAACYGNTMQITFSDPNNP